MNILIIEDEVSIARSLAQVFRKVPRVHNVKILHDAQQALEMALSGIYDLLIVDIVLGTQERAGLSLCERIRKKNASLPLIVITGLRSLPVLTAAFKLGVNEYITKPFDIAELELRVRRWFGADLIIPEENLSYFDLKYDSISHEVFFGEKNLHLSKKNKALLLLFLRRPEYLLTHDFLMQKYWGDLEFNPHRNLRQSISRLRSSLDEKCQDWIRVAPGEGYYLKKNLIVR